MQQLNEAIQTLLAAQPRRLILSKPRPAAQWRRVEVRRLETGWQLACYTDTQVFHENLDPDAFGPRLEQLAAAYGQLNGWSQGPNGACSSPKRGWPPSSARPTRLRRRPLPPPTTGKSGICWPRAR